MHSASTMLVYDMYTFVHELRNFKIAQRNLKTLKIAQGNFKIAQNLYFARNIDKQSSIFSIRATCGVGG